MLEWIMDNGVVHFDKQWNVCLRDYDQSKRRVDERPLTQSKEGSVAHQKVQELQFVSAISRHVVNDFSLQPIRSLQQ